MISAGQFAALAALVAATATALPSTLARRNGPNGYADSSSMGDCGPCDALGGDDPCSSIPAGQNVNTNQVLGTPWYTGLLVQPGASLTLTETHTVGYTWTVGANLGLSVPAISFAGSWSESVSTSTAEGATQTCPTGGNWQCSMQVTPHLWETSGFLGTQLNGNPGVVICGQKDQPFTIQVPAVDSQGNNVASAAICVCPNADGSPIAGLPDGQLVCAACTGQ